MEDDLAELLRLLLQRNLLVLFPEEFRVGQAGGEHLAVAGDDRRAAVMRLDIGGADEIGRENKTLPCTRRGGFQDREIFLVGRHRQLDDFGRHVQESGVEAAEQRHRPFGEAGILLQQRLVADEGEAGLRRDCRRGGGDDRLALVLIDDDVAGAQLRRIVRRRSDGHAARMMEAVADRLGARGDAVDRERHHLAAQQRDDALQRAHPAQALRREGRRAPAHRLGPGKGVHDRRDRFRQHRRSGAAGLVDHREPHAVAVGELLRRQPRLAQEAFQRLRRRGRARAFQFLADRFRLGGQVARDERKAARRRESLDRAGDQPRLRDLRLEQPRKITPRLLLHPRGDFLAEEFEKEIRHATHPGKFACHSGVFFSIHDAHAPFARSRTRPI